MKGWGGARPRREKVCQLPGGLQGSRVPAAERVPAPTPTKLQKIPCFCPSISIKLLWGLSFLHRQLPVATGHTLIAPRELGHSKGGVPEQEDLSCCIDKVRDPLVRGVEEG